MKKNRFSWLALTAVGALLLAGCAGQADNGDSSDGGSGTDAASEVDPEGSIVFYDSAPNPSLDPADIMSDSSFSQAVLYALYERILTFDGSGEIQEGLATDWGFVEDSLDTFEFTLRDGLTFHDGEVLNAEAVKTNIERLKEVGDEAGATVKAAAANVDSVEAVDELTVRVNLSEPDGAFPYALATQFGMMVSPAALEGGATGIELEAVGSGPFKLVSFDPNQTTVLERFEDFWAGTEDRPKNFEVHYVTDDQTRLNALRSGQANVSLLTPRQYQDATSSGLEVNVNNTTSMWVMYENTSRALGDVRVRQALMHAIDRESIASGLTFDTGSPTYQLIPEGGVGFYDEAESLYPYDPEKAQELLNEAGHGDGLELEFVLLNTPEYVQITEVLQQQLGEIGITLNIVTVDIAQAGVFMSGESGDLMLARWGGRADPLNTLEIVIGEQGTYAPAGAVTEELANLLNAAGAYAADDPERFDAILAANVEAVEQAANIPVITRSNIYGFEEGCIIGLDEYLASGSNDWRDVKVAPGCSN